MPGVFSFTGHEPGQFRSEHVRFFDGLVRESGRHSGWALLFRKVSRIERVNDAGSPDIAADPIMERVSQEVFCLLSQSFPLLFGESCHLKLEYRLDRFPGASTLPVIARLELFKKGNHLFS